MADDDQTYQPGQTVTPGDQGAHAPTDDQPTDVPLEAVDEAKADEDPAVEQRSQDPPAADDQPLPAAKREEDLYDTAEPEEHPEVSNQINQTPEESNRSFFKSEPAGPKATAFSWQASEYIQHKHGFGWYAILVVLLMIIALVVYAQRVPRVLNYALTDAGIKIGERFFPYNSFRSFSLIPDKGFFSIELDPLKRFMPRLSIYLDPEQADKVAQALAQWIPRSDREPDFFDRLSRALKI
jgi:hypothetical protein